MSRAPGLSVRLKLTLSYAGFLMLAGAVLLAAGYFSLSRGVHPGVIFVVRSHAECRVEAGSVRALAVSGEARSQALPNVPTIAEAGMPRYRAVGWFGGRRCTIWVVRFGH